MFTPRDRTLERGWPGLVEGDSVFQLAAQTLQSFFTGGGSAREHAEYALADVDLRPPILHPPAVRDFMAFEEHVATARRRRGSVGVCPYRVAPWPHTSNAWSPRLPPTRWLM